MRTMHAWRRGFTLIELLVVIGIIGILVAASLVVGTKVVGGGKERATIDTIRLLDTALQNYIQEVGEIPGPTVDDPAINVTVTHVIADVESAAGTMVDTTSLFLLQAAKVKSASEAVKALPSQYVRKTGTQQQFTVVNDAWGNPIRYVHPAFDGRIDPQVTSASLIGPAPAGRTYKPTDIHRTNTISDIGLCPNNRPYFYSCGPDGRPETLEDNVYLVKPQVSVD